jgi:hypothetical protein
VPTPAGRVCSILNARECVALHGRWRGPNTTCDNACTLPANCDWNQDGTNDIQDLIDFLGDYRNGDADFNGDGVTNQLDMLAMIDCIR